MADGVRGTGAVPSPAWSLANAPKFGDWVRATRPVPIVPPGGAIDFRHFLPPVKDQGTSSACCGFGFSMALSAAFGMCCHSDGPIDFDEWWIYSLGNGGKDQGASPWQTGKELAIRGALPSHSAFSVRPNLDFRSYPPDALGEAAGWRLRDALYIGGIGVSGALNAMHQIHESLDLGRPVAMGIVIPEGFGEVSSAGFAGTKGYGTGGHLMAVVGRDSVRHRGKAVRALRVVNSWGTDWGDGGYAFLLPDHFRRSGWVEAVSIASVDGPGDPPAPRHGRRGRTKP